MNEKTPCDDVTYESRLQQLVAVVQELSLARSLDAIMAIVRKAARELTGADGATFVLRDREHCYYADEDAVAPLWKGQRFPLHECVSGWVMQTKESCAIEDIYKDPRIPWDAYRPTFVKSLLMVPIRRMEPIGAIGNYWALTHVASQDEIRILQALADTTAVAMENVRLYEELERRVLERTHQIERVNRLLQMENAVRIRAEDELRRQAITDTLTGLLNRRGFFQAAKERLRAIAEPSRQCAIVFVDIDGLKAVNDSLGHDVGDKMIVAAAEILKDACDGDIVARLGGDEFAIMLESAQEVESVLRRIVQYADDYMDAQRSPFVLSLSVGAASFAPDSTNSLDDSLNRADKAMYQHKRGKKRPAEAVREQRRDLLKL